MLVLAARYTLAILLMASWKTFSTASRLLTLLLGTEGHKLKVALSKVQNKKTVVLHTGHSYILEVLDTVH